MVPRDLPWGSTMMRGRTAHAMDARESDRRQSATRKPKMALTLEEANRIAQGAVTKARELNIRISVAVCDAGGRLVAFQRMDNAIWASVYGSQGKAIASAAFGRPSGVLAERA